MLTADHRPEYVLLAAAKVGGILANDSYPADFLRDNIAIQTNVIDAAYRNGVRKLMFLGSSCVYPKHAPQPLREEYLLTGPLEPTNEWYAIAKIAGLKMCEAYRRQYGFNAISAMPTNLYGPEGNFSLETSHVLPALIRKFHEAKEGGERQVEVWGTGTPRREFLHVDDLAVGMFVPHGAVRGRAIDQRRLGKGRHDSRARATIGDRGLYGLPSLRHDEAGRYAAQAARCRAADCSRLVAADHIRDRNKVGLYSWFLSTGPEQGCNEPTGSLGQHRHRCPERGREDRELHSERAVSDAL